MTLTGQLHEERWELRVEGSLWVGGVGGVGSGRGGPPVAGVALFGSWVVGGRVVLSARQQTSWVAPFNMSWLALEELVSDFVMDASQHCWFTQVRTRPSRDGHKSNHDLFEFEGSMI